MTTRPECTCDRLYFADHVLSCPVKTRLVSAHDEIEIWFDRRGADGGRFVVLRSSEEVGEFSWKDMMSSTDIPHLGSDRRSIHTRSRCSSRFGCDCHGTSTTRCPTHRPHEYPIHEECRGDGCDGCDGKGYIKKPFDWQSEVAR